MPPLHSSSANIYSGDLLFAPLSPSSVLIYFKWPITPSVGPLPLQLGWTGFEGDVLRSGASYPQKEGHLEPECILDPRSWGRWPTPPRPLPSCCLTQLRLLLRSPRSRMLGHLCLQSVFMVWLAHTASTWGEWRPPQGGFNIWDHTALIKLFILKSNISFVVS